MSFGWRGKKEFDDHFAFFDKMFRTLKKQGKINSDYINLRKQSEKLINYSDNCRKGFNQLDYAINLERMEEFLKHTKKFGFDESIWMTNYTSILMYLILMNYANIEQMLLTILNGARYGNDPDDYIKGSETLGQLIKKIKKLYPEGKIADDVLDIKFRNAIAHGWYFITHDGMTYYQDALLEKKVNLSVEKLLRKQIRLNILGMAITYLVLGMDY